MYKSPRSAARVAKTFLTLAALITASVAVVELTSTQLKPLIQFWSDQASHLVALIGSAVIYSRTLKNVEALTGRSILPHWTAYVIGFAPLAAILVVLTFSAAALLRHTFNLDVEFGVILFGIVLYVGWILSGALWPFLWGRVLKRLENASTHGNNLLLLNWSVFIVQVAVLALAMSTYGKDSPILVTAVGAFLQLGNILIWQMLTQDIKITQLRLARIRGVEADVPEQRLIKLPAWAIWCWLFIALGTVSFAITLDLPILRNWLQ